jgi:RES domain-containing protein
VRVYRVFSRKHERTACTGEGAQRFGGRWNAPGIAVVYAATSLSLTLLEIMANARRRIPPDMLYCSIDIPESVRVEVLETATLPSHWHQAPAPPELQEIGGEWVRRATSAVLFVPSAIARIENNVIINPNHVDFARLSIGKPHELPIDGRLR